MTVETGGGTELETLTLDGTYDQNQFALTQSGSIDQITYDGNSPCYCSGTRIATERGEVAVEDLRIGDWVLTASGALRPIVWIGRRDLDVTRHRWPLEVQPVRVVADAFGEGLPRRDLWLSPQHAVFVDGALIPIIRLANGATVRQEQVENVSYWHVELESPDVLLAEGLPAESFLDCGSRAGFANYDGFVALHPTFVPQSWDDACAPLRESGEEVEATRARLLARAEDLGFRRSNDADLHILADGQRIDSRRGADGSYAFDLPARAKRVSLASLFWRPADADGAVESDGRPLGVAVRAVEVDGAALNLGALGRGWHGVEGAGDQLWRWTSGRAELPAGARKIVLRLARAASYWAAPGIVRLLADGVEIAARPMGGGQWLFDLPAAASTIHLVSPGWSPAEDGGADLRRLGVAVRRIEIDGREHDLSGLRHGWHEMEGGETNHWRWTDGCASLPPAAAQIVVTLSGGKQAGRRVIMTAVACPPLPEVA